MEMCVSGRSEVTQVKLGDNAGFGDNEAGVALSTSCISSAMVASKVVQRYNIASIRKVRIDL